MVSLFDILDVIILYIAPLDMKGFICHFGKWQINPKTFNVTILVQVPVFLLLSFLLARVTNPSRPPPCHFLFVDVSRLLLQGPHPHRYRSDHTENLQKPKK